VYSTELQQWKADATVALTESTEERVSSQQAREDKKRIKELEHDLRREDKALAETAALLALSNQWRRSSVGARTNDPPGRSPDHITEHRTGSTCMSSDYVARNTRRRLCEQNDLYNTRPKKTDDENRLFKPTNLPGDQIAADTPDSPSLMISVI
jgi:hypothetical protein